MALRSVVALRNLVDRVEQIAADIRVLKSAENEGGTLPDLPVPLVLAALIEWLGRVEEIRRKARLAESKRLLI